MAQRMLAGPMGSTVQWTRRVLSSNGPEGTVSVQVWLWTTVGVPPTSARSSTKKGVLMSAVPLLATEIQTVTSPAAQLSAQTSMMRPVRSGRPLPETGVMSPERKLL